MIVGASQFVYSTHKEGNSDAPRYSTGMKDQGEYLNLVGVCLIDYFILFKLVYILFYIEYYFVRILIYNDIAILEECIV